MNIINVKQISNMNSMLEDNNACRHIFMLNYILGVIRLTSFIKQKNMNFTTESISEENIVKDLYYLTELQIISNIQHFTANYPEIFQMGLIRRDILFNLPDLYKLCLKIRLKKSQDKNIKNIKKLENMYIDKITKEIEELDQSQINSYVSS